MRESLVQHPGASGQVRVRVRAGPSGRRGGPQGRRRLGGADPRRPGRGHRTHRRRRSSTNRCRASGNRRNRAPVLASVRISGTGRTRRDAAPPSIRCSRTSIAPLLGACPRRALPVLGIFERLRRLSNPEDRNVVIASRCRIGSPGIRHCLRRQLLVVHSGVADTVAVTGAIARTGAGGTPSSVAIPVGAASLGTAAFMPDQLSVAVGETVTWTNTDAVAHTSTSDAAGWDSGIVAPGGHFSSTFQTAERFLTTAPFTRAWSARSSFTDVHSGGDRHHS